MQRKKRDDARGVEIRPGSSKTSIDIIDRVFITPVFGNTSINTINSNAVDTSHVRPSEETFEISSHSAGNRY